MELGTYSDLTSFIGEAFPYYRTWQSFTFLFWVGFYITIIIPLVGKIYKRYFSRYETGTARK